MENPAGESNDGVLRLDFDRRLKLEFHGSPPMPDCLPTESSMTPSVLAPWQVR